MRNYGSVRSRRARGTRSLAPARTRKLFGEALECRWMLAQTTGLFFNDPGTADGFTLFSPNTAKTTYLIDNQGSVVHQWQSSYVPGLLGYLLPDGSLLRDGSPHGQGGNGSISAAGAGGLLERFNWAGTKIWEYSYDSTTHLAHHDFQVLPNGNVLLVAWELKTEAEATQAGRDPNLPGAGYLYPDSIVEVQPDLVHGGGAIVWEWHVWDHMVQQFDSTKNNWQGATGVAQHPELINVNYVSTADEGGGQAEDWNHTNGIDYNPDLDEIVVSVREFSEFWIIDHSTTTAQAASHSGGLRGKGGDLLYRWGNPQTYGAGTASDRVLYYQHDAKWIPNGLPGTGDITVFNNGFGRPGQDFSEVDEITPPLIAGGTYALTPGQAYGPATTTWQYQAPVANFSAIIGGAQRLANGDTRISYGVSGNFTEVTSAGQEVWKYVNPYTGGGTLGPTTPIPSLGLTDPGLSALLVNFTFQAVQYPRSYVTQLLSSVAGRQLFYNNSFFDNPANNASFSNDTAIALDKSPYLPGTGESTFANVSSYSAGINGVDIDLTAGGSHASLNASDFSFKVSGPFASNSPSTWSTLATAPTVIVRSGAGAGGTDRVELIWPDGTIVGTWLQVTLKSGPHSGLGADDVFYFGSLAGDSGQGNEPDAAFTDATDEIVARNNQESNLFANHPLSVAIANLYDYDRDGQVGGIDEVQARSFGATNGELDMINLVAGGSLSLTSSAVAADPTDVFLDGAGAAVTSALARTVDSLVSRAFVPILVDEQSYDLESSGSQTAGNLESAQVRYPPRDALDAADDKGSVDNFWIEDELLNSLLGLDSPVY